MTIVSQKSTRDFIRKAKFPKLSSASKRRRALQDQPPVQLKTNEAQALVVGSGLIIAGEKVPAQTREDLIDCTLFAQLAASGEVGESAHVNEWYVAYFNALSALGWAQSDSQFEEYEFSSHSAQAHKAMIPVLTALLGPGAAALAVLKAALEGLQSMEENKPWITLFDSQSRTDKSARFQVATSHADEEGILHIALVAFELEARAEINQVLFWSFTSSSTRLHYSAGKATIYEAALQEQRSALKGRLAAYRTDYVGQVKLAPVRKAKTLRRSIGKSRSTAGRLR